jgi:serine-type D-Ala-D-Ala carboxypeptidase/endopeptidase (penicillin-binding protein 4)
MQKYLHSIKKPMRKTSLLLTCFSILISQFALASVEDIFLRNSKALETSDLNHSLCYAKEPTEGADLKVEGYNVNGRVRMASVSKLITSYWAIKQLGPDYKYRTKFYFDPATKELHIEGARDPFFGRRTIYYIVSELNRVGISEISKLTFDEAFTFFPSVEDKSMRYTSIGVAGGVTKESVQAGLEFVLNTSRWEKIHFTRYKEVKGLAAKKGLTFTESPQLATLTVQFQSRSEFVPRAHFQVYEYSSVSIRDYLKQMNNYSLNYTADEIFRTLGGTKRFAEFMYDDLRITNKELYMQTGSGLPDSFHGERVDNHSDCATLMKVVHEMSKYMRTSKLGDLKDIMMVAGVDAGTLGKFYEEPSLRGAVVAKTGTLSTAITLNGYASTQSGRIYFGLNWQIGDESSSAKARTYRDQVVAELVKDFGGAKALKYTPREFAPFDQNSKFSEFLGMGLFMTTSSPISFKTPFLDLNAFDEEINVSADDLATGLY